MNDPTYDRNKIEARTEWKLAFLLSELFNDDAPLGWGKYIPAASAAIEAAMAVNTNRASSHACPTCGAGERYL